MEITFPDVKTFCCILFLFSCHTNSNKFPNNQPNSGIDTVSILKTTTKKISKSSINREMFFNNQQPFKILSFENTIEKSSTDSDTLKCKKWKLSKENIKDIIKHCKEIDGTTWDLSFLVLSCTTSGKILQNHQEYRLSINAGSFLSVSNADTTIILGDFNKADRKYFLEKPNQ